MTSALVPTFLHQSPLSVDDLASLVCDLAENPDAWRHRLRFNTDERWWTRLAGDEVADVWLLTWVTDTNTDLHDHGDSAGAFIVVAGELEEVRPAADGASLDATRLGTGDLRFVEPGAVHDVRNPGLAPAVSIHAYSPPLRHMTFYEQRAAGPAPTRTVATHAEGDHI